MPIDNRESGALHTLLETKVKLKFAKKNFFIKLLASFFCKKVARIEQLEQRIALYEDEINRLRDQRLQTSRNFAEKTMSDHQFNELKHKVCWKIFHDTLVSFDFIPILNFLVPIKVRKYMFLLSD